MDIRQMKYFAAVADTLNFSRAAESLFISQSALSKQVADLEHELGLVLLKRDKRSVELTTAGQAFLNEAKAILFRMDKIPAVIAHTGMEDDYECSVTIALEDRASNVAYVRDGITEAISQIRKQMPGLRPVFHVAEYLKVNQMLKLGQADVAVFFTGTKEDLNRWGKYELIYEEEMILAYRDDSNGTQSTIAEILSKKDLYMIDQDFRGMSQIMQILGELGMVPDIKFCENHINLLMMLLSGEGCVIIPQSLASSIQNIDICKLSIPLPEAKIYYTAVYNENQSTTLAKEVIGQAQKLISEMLSR